MIARRKKLCTDCKTDQYIWSHGLCLACWRKKAGVKISPISAHKRERNKEYLALRNDYLKEHPLCEVCKVRLASEIHHKRGRVGDNLFEDFLAVDRDCHRRIEENPDWAREQGYVLTRL